MYQALPLPRIIHTSMRPFGYAWHLSTVISTGEIFIALLHVRFCSPNCSFSKHRVVSSSEPDYLVFLSRRTGIVSQADAFVDFSSSQHIQLSNHFSRTSIFPMGSVHSAIFTVIEILQVPFELPGVRLQERSLVRNDPRPTPFSVLGESVGVFDHLQVYP